METRADTPAPAALRVCIVIPTYKEARNIEPLMDRIFAVMAEQHETVRPVDLHVLVVDDSSPDGTASLVKAYAQKNPAVHLLVREEKRGLGAAYIAGMTHALETLSPEIVFEMDADHSHDPKYLPGMIRAVEDGADFVIGSRYVEGGGIPENWGLHRKVISALASGITKCTLGLRGIKDTSGGFRAIRADVLRKVDLGSLHVKGFAFQAALLEAAVHHGFKVKEVPIHFIERHEGKSKMRLRDMVEGWTIIFRIKAKRFFSG